MTAATPRRRARAERGIYYRDVDGRRVYEITYTDRFGKQRWEVVHGGGIAAARALRGKRLTDGGKLAEASRDTFGQVAGAWLKTKRHLKPNTLAAYGWALERINRKLGKTPIGAITPDDLAAFIAELRDRGLAEWSLHGHATVLSGVFKHAVRRKLIPENPWAALAAEEKPGQEASRQMRILDRRAIDDVLAAAAQEGDQALVLLTTATFTGMRLGELLALRWGSIDTKGRHVRVTEQFTARHQRAPVKSKRGRREIVLPGFVLKRLVEHRLASGHSTERAPVFASRTGTPLERKVARNILRRAITTANQHRATHNAQLGPGELELPPIPQIRLHDLRHTYASILIAQGEDVIFVSRQLGHARPSITLDIYGDLFDHARHADQARDRLDDEFGDTIGGLS